MGCLGWEMFRAIAVLFLDEGAGINVQGTFWHDGTVVLFQGVNFINAICFGV